ncbi:tetratricopeptide repeat protein [Vibrio crassostreae]|uniref:tetratricopeptide repeat protein n=1 Tax=Vibrio crassostreae TaxID=246167 RepID=UPI001B307BC9|nr:tetratricopeptide repeat protein [Vibrio crassostreae]
MSRKHILLFPLAIIPAALSAAGLERSSFDDMVKADLSFPAVQVYKAEMAEKRGDFDGAAMHYINAMKGDYTAVIGNVADLIESKRLSGTVSLDSAKEISRLASNDAQLSYFLGEFYYNDPVNKDLNDAFFWHNNAMRLGSIESMERVATMVVNSQGGSESVYSQVDALTMFKKVVDIKGTPELAFEIANTLYNGGIVKRDLPRAFEYYEMAANGGILPAHYTLGYMLEKGLGVRKSEADAIEHYHMALETDSEPDSLYRLARIHLYTDSAASDPILGYSYLSKSAKKGQVDANYKLGLMHFYGTETVKADVRLALDYFETASNLGYRMATLKLKDIYTQGAAGVQPDRAKVREMEKRLQG